MAPTFDTNSDAMPIINGHLRVKYVHSVGVAGKFKFISNGSHPYTGVFEGADYGILRFSSAFKPSATSPLSPGLGLKFLRNGVKSADSVF